MIAAMFSPGGLLGAAVAGVTEVDLGGFKAGDRSKTKVVMPLTYLCIRRDNVVLREIDLINTIDRTADIDFSDVMRTALGLTL